MFKKTFWLTRETNGLYALHPEEPWFGRKPTWTEDAWWCSHCLSNRNVCGNLSQMFGYVLMEGEYSNIEVLHPGEYMKVTLTIEEEK